MNPFDSPPSTPPVGFDPPQLIQPPSRRGRMALVALASAGLVVGGVVVVSQFASADRPSTAAADSAPPTPAPTLAPTSGEPTGEPSDRPDAPELPEFDGQITIDLGTGDPITFDLGEISECLGDLPMFNGSMPPMPPIEMPAVDLPHVGGEGTITVVGPDGVSVIDFGEGDGSVTITRSDGELTVTSEGDVDVQELDDVFRALPGVGGEPSEHPRPAMPGLPDFGELEACLDGLD